ncbi:MAG TPA: hypothetical protein VHZ04_01410 [Candidatus Paceibacterota bacterium]|jgi:hypothetical protein|nr:hypothetical protein [Candidatus Paceibacterota bacterium]
MYEVLKCVPPPNPETAALIIGLNNQEEKTAERVLRGLRYSPQVFKNPHYAENTALASRVIVAGFELEPDSGMNGHQFLQKIAAMLREQGKSIPILVLVYRGTLTDLKVPGRVIQLLQRNFSDADLKRAVGEPDKGSRNHRDGDEDRAMGKAAD